MKNEARAHLYDILQAGEAVKGFVKGRTFEEYEADKLLRSGVERQFEIMGEALNRIRRDDPELLAGIRDYQNIISFRNILVHGYDAIDDSIVWDAVEEDLEPLLEDVRRLMAG